MKINQLIMNHMDLEVEDSLFNEKGSQLNQSASAVLNDSTADDVLWTDFQDMVFNNMIFPEVSNNTPYKDAINKQQLKIEILGELGCNINDLALFKGKSNRIGWSNNLQMITLNQKHFNKNFDHFYQHFLIIKRPEFITDIVNCRTICRQIISTPNFNYDCLENNILSQLKFIEIQKTDDLPIFSVKTDQQSANYLLNEQLDIFQRTATSLTYLRVWRLICALWADISIKDEQVYLLQWKRKELLTEWLKEIIIEKSNNKTNSFMLEDELETKINKILSFTISNQISEAAKYAFNTNFVNLSLLITQINSSDEFKNLMRSQLQKWIQFGVYKHLPHSLLKIYMLLAGEMTLVLPDHQFVNACEALDWKEIFGCHLWYFSNPNSSINSSIDSYDQIMRTLNKNSDPEYLNAVSDDLFEPFDNPVKDICYYLLKLYTDNSYPLDRVLNPLNYGRDAFDFEFAWYLLIILKSFNCNSISNNFQTYLIVNFMNQLEANGCWEFAVYVLMFLEDRTLKQNLFLKILKRNLNTNLTEPCPKELFLTEHLSIPENIIQAIKKEKISDFNQSEPVSIIYSE